VKDFIKLGLDFVRSHPDADQQLDLKLLLLGMLSTVQQT
jgi:hypothetical protein